MKIEILGARCAQCNELVQNAEGAVRELGLDVKVAEVTDPKEIAKYGVMLTPALAIDGAVVIVGRVLSTEQIRRMLEERLRCATEEEGAAGEGAAGE